jgi:hypothetical protein
MKVLVALVIVVCVGYVFLVFVGSVLDRANRRADGDNEGG